MMKKLNDLINELHIKAEELSSMHEKVKTINSILEKSKNYADSILPQMERVREVADSIEVLLGEEYKPFPSYEDLLFSVQ